MLTSCQARGKKNYLFSESLEAVELAIDVVAVVVDGTTKGVFKPNSWPKLRGKTPGLRLNAMPGLKRTISK